MDWRDIPVGIIKYEELLNALLAIWKTRYTLANQRLQDEFTESYDQGFEDGLDAIAQFAGIADVFETCKNDHKLKIEHKLNTKAKLITSVKYIEP